MAKDVFPKIIDNIFNLEKGYVYRSVKADPGGPTNYGITLETYRAWNNDNKLNREALKMMPKSEAKKIYKAQYWNTIRADEMPLGVDFCVFDFAVNSGPGRAVMELQKVLGVKVDGVVGLMTLSAINTYKGKGHALIADLSRARLKFMKGLSNWPYNKNGWTKRVKAVMGDAQSMRLAIDYKPEIAAVTPTPKANAKDLAVSKALVSKEAVTILTVAVPAISGVLIDFQPAKFVIAGLVACFGALALYWALRNLRKVAI